MLIINNLNLSGNFSEIEPPQLLVLQQRHEISPADGVGLFLLIKDRGEELVALVKFLFRYNEPATLIIENPKLSVPTVHEDEYCSRPRILMKHIAYVVDQRVPLVAETHVAFAVFVAHS